MEEVNNLNLGDVVQKDIYYDDNKKELNGINTNNTPTDLSTIPLGALRPTSCQCLSTLLNPLKIIPTESGLPRDWRGLAELMGVSTELIPFLESKQDPTGELLKKLSISRDNGLWTLSDLQAFLAVMDRFDVVEDVNPLFEADAETYTLASSSRSSRQVHAIESNSDQDVLTIGDLDSIMQGEGRGLSHYDAFILHSEEDSEFATQIIDKMEKEYDLKICAKDRDILPGVMFEHEVIGRLIEERCNRLLVIFSPSFLESRANQFLVSYAQALALEKRQRKIIPCMYKKCELPPSVRYSFCLNFSRAGKLWNFWDKLASSLKSSSNVMVPPLNSNKAIEESNDAKLKRLENGIKSLSQNAWDPEKKSYIQTSSSLNEGPNTSHANSLENTSSQSVIDSPHQSSLTKSKEQSKPFKWIDKFKLKGKSDQLKSKKDKVKNKRGALVAE